MGSDGGITEAEGLRDDFFGCLEEAEAEAEAERDITIF
jgi:hypothetical protein